VSGAEEGRDGGRSVGAHQPIGAAMADAHFCETVEVTQEVLPFRNEAGFAQEVVEMLCIASARNEQKTCPRMAASEE
jgi:hypothetical protein